MPKSDRREFIIKFSQLGALTLFGGAVWSGFLSSSKATAFGLRPPGALPEREYLATCIKCGQCVDACPYDTLYLGRTGQNASLGVPKFDPRKIPCYMCTDVPCARVCPTGALDQQVKIEEARMGLAVVIDRENCIAFQGLRCEVCFNVCPLKEKAIKLQYRPQERTGKHAFFEPVVYSDACTGCGLCEHACILNEPAIKVLPVDLAKGKKGDHYLMGWKDKGKISTDFKAEEEQRGKKDKKWEQDALGNSLKSLEDTEGIYE